MLFVKRKRISVSVKIILKNIFKRCFEYEVRFRTHIVLVHGCFIILESSHKFEPTFLLGIKYITGAPTFMFQDTLTGCYYFLNLLNVI